MILSHIQDMDDVRIVLEVKTKHKMKKNCCLVLTSKRAVNYVDILYDLVQISMINYAGSHTMDIMIWPLPQSRPWASYIIILFALEIRGGGVCPCSSAHAYLYVEWVLHLYIAYFLNMLYVFSYRLYHVSSLEAFQEIIQIVRRLPYFLVTTDPIVCYRFGQ